MFGPLVVDLEGRAGLVLLVVDLEDHLVGVVLAIDGPEDRFFVDRLGDLDTVLFEVRGDPGAVDGHLDSCAGVLLAELVLLGGGRADGSLAEVHDDAAEDVAGLLDRDGEGGGGLVETDLVGQLLVGQFLRGLHLRVVVGPDVEAGRAFVVIHAGLLVGLGVVDFHQVGGPDGAVVD